LGGFEEYIFLRAAVAVGVSLVGACLATAFGRASHRVLCALVSFAAGALLAVVLTELIPESSQRLGWLRATGATLVGLGLFYVIGKRLSLLCPACDATATDEMRGFLRLSWLLIAAVAFHAFMDGVAIAVSTGEHGRLGRAGLLTLVAVSYHKLPEGLALATLCLAAGRRRLVAFAITLGVELATLVGPFLGLLLHHLPGMWLGLAIGIAAGSFCYVTAFAMIEEMREHEKGSVLAYAFLGIASILLLSLALM